MISVCHDATTDRQNQKSAGTHATKYDEHTTDEHTSTREPNLIFGNLVTLPSPHQFRSGAASRPIMVSYYTSVFCAAMVLTAVATGYARQEGQSSRVCFKSWSYHFFNWKLLQELPLHHHSVIVLVFLGWNISSIQALPIPVLDGAFW